MKLIITVLSLFTLLLPPLVNAQEEPQAEIKAITATLELNLERKMTVTEQIATFVAGELLQSGIMRAQPLSVSKTDGSPIVLEYEIKTFSIDGEPWPYTILAGRDYNILLLGDEERKLAPGEHTLAVNYTVNHAVLPQANGSDILFWSLTGAEMDVPIKKIKAQISLPPGVPVDPAIVKIFSRKKDAEREPSDKLAIRKADGKIVVENIKDLELGEEIWVEVNY